MNWNETGFTSANQLEIEIGECDPRTNQPNIDIDDESMYFAIARL